MANDLGTGLVFRVADCGIHRVHAVGMEGCDVEMKDPMKDPVVAQLDAEYRMLRSELEREVNKFELMRKQFNKRSRNLADDITRKWLELQRAKQESRA
jgi:hypothetical protein